MKIFKKFTLIELLIVISIVLILVSLLQPALQMTMRNAKQVVDLNAIRQVGNVSTLKADDQAGLLPKGDRDGSFKYDIVADDIAWFNHETYVSLTKDYGLKKDDCACISYKEENGVPKRVGKMRAKMGTLILWNYWGDRDDEDFIDVDIEYITPKRLDDDIATSKTLLTCWVYGSYREWNSPIPHAPDEAISVPPSPQGLLDFPIGVNVLRLDGSGKWADFSLMQSVKHVADYFYYLPDTE